MTRLRQRTRRSRTSLAVVAAAAIGAAILPFGELRAATDTQTGAPGSTGANGVYPNPGGTGGTGGSTNATSVNATDASNTADSTAGPGGLGGIGGTNFPSSGTSPGGLGGLGGSASATAAQSASVNAGTVSSTATAIGGAGGKGGNGRVNSGVQGLGGTGGNGGSGTASAIARSGFPGLLPDVIAFAKAVGGDGGMGGTRNGSGGDGGLATLGETSANSTGDAAISVTGIVIGGNGGSPVGSGHGGNGASTNLNNNVTISTGFAEAVLLQQATGGNSGGGGVGDPGLAGSATSILNEAYGNLTNIQATTDAFGGNGGDSGSALGSTGGTAYASTTMSGNGSVTVIAESNVPFAPNGTAGHGNGSNIITGTGTGGLGASGFAYTGASSSGATGRSQVTSSSRAAGGDGGSVIGPALGNGGAGGGAEARSYGFNSSADFVLVNADSYAGPGGQANGAGFTGGAGGNVTITSGSASSGTSSSGQVQVRVRALGGNGGSGLSGAAAGNGGSASIFNGVSGFTAGGLILSQHAYGGASGTSTGGAPAVGGAGTSSLSRTLAVAPGALSVESAAFGGAGGSAQGASAASAGDAFSNLSFTTPGPLRAYSTANVDTFLEVGTFGFGGGVTSGTGNGGNGSNGTAKVTATGTGIGSIVASATANGGNGGIGRGSGFAGGAGGIATILSSAANSGSGLASLTVNAHGGNGGAGLDGAAGGNGASIALDNLVGGSTSGQVFLEQDAIGGNGGGSDGGAPGTPGMGISNVSRSFTVPRDAEVSVLAVGGSGGDVQNTNGHAGAVGSASVNLNGNQVVRGDVAVGGGAGGSITGGLNGFTAGDGADAIGTASVTSSGTANSSSDANVGVSVFGGLGGNVSSLIFGSGGAGGSGFATVTALGAGPDGASAGAGAYGSFGGSGSGAGFHSGNGGNAISSAIATNTGGKAWASASSTAYGPGLALNGAFPGAIGTATASASATGLNAAEAFVVATGGSGTGSAVSHANSSGLFSFLQASGSGVVDAHGGSYTAAYVNTPVPGVGSGSLYQSTAYVVGTPLANDVSTRWASDTNVKNALGNDTANVHVLAFSDVQYPGGGTGTHTYSTVLELNENNAALTGNNLILGMLTPQLDGGGAGLQPGDSLRFRIMKQGTTIADQTFTTNPSVLSYFQDTVMLLGAQNAGVGSANLDLQFLFDLTGTHPTAGVGVQFILGTNVIAQGSTWNNSAGGPWGTPANWTGNATPDGAGVSATFGSVIAAPRTVNVDNNFTVGAIIFDNANSYTLSGNSVTIATASGAGNITINNGTHTIASALILNADTNFNSATSTGLAVTGNLTATGKTITKAGLGSIQFNNVRAAALNVAGGSARISTKGTANSAGGTSVVSSLSISPGASLDLANNSMIIDYTGPVGTQVSDLRNHLKNGRLTTSSGTTTTRLGYGDNAILGKTTFAGQSPDSSSVLIKYTYAGDADLDGDADGVDIGTWATNFTGELGGAGSAVWTQGDWDYDGDVDGVDAGLWAQAFTGELGGGGLGGIVVNDPSITPGAAAILRGMGITVVPEPASLTGLGLGLAGAALARRRRFR